MLTTLRKRTNNKDEGFTLIELMVVVLIIGILMAIAIPVFLGAKGSANDRSAQENARNVLTDMKSFYSDNQVYPTVAADFTTIKTDEPNITILNSLPAIPATIQAVYYLAKNNNDPTATNFDLLQMAVKSKSGTCFYLDDEAVAPVAPKTTPVGTYYTSSTKCTAPAAPTAAPVSGKGAAGVWGTTW